ncbi:MAG: hypothetical protein EXQ69_09265, partial [Acidimicrobiia bacterium]|nr:hypothetical protein [Acidimicrobiia bacterium]
MTEPSQKTPPFNARLLEADDAPALVGAIRESYGETYDCAWLYDEVEIARRIDDGTMVSVGGFLDSGRLVAHYAVLLDAPDAKVGESGQAVVAPDFRGHKAFSILRVVMTERFAELGRFGFYAEATAAHSYSQRASIAGGAHETGFLLGYIPATVAYTDIKMHEAGRRQSVALLWTTTNPLPTRVVHLPERHREIVERIYGNANISRTIDTSVIPLPERPTRITIEDRPDHNEATLVIEEIGSDVLEALRWGLRVEADRGREVAFVHIHMGDPMAAAIPEAIHSELGVFFGGVIPERRNGDVLVLQWIGDAEIDPSDIETASDFGRELLEFVL